MSDDYDIIGIYVDYSKTPHEFRVRGFGRIYDEFYSDLNIIRHKLTNEIIDFPWHYFSFLNEYDEEYMTNKYGVYFIKELFDD